MSDFYILGGGFITSASHGYLNDTPRFSNELKSFSYPELKNLLPELPPRFGRFDEYTRLSFSAAVLALKDSSMLFREEKENAAIVLGSKSECYETDKAYYETTLENDGEFSSPNLFSYTLANVTLGEQSVFFKFTGPTFCTGNESGFEGREALRSAVNLLKLGISSKALVLWAESSPAFLSPDEKRLYGAAALLLSKEKNESSKAGYSFSSYPTLINDYFNKEG